MIEQEIEKLRREIRELQQLQKSAVAKKAQRPHIRIGKIKAVTTDENNNSLYEIAEIDAEGNELNATYVDVRQVDENSYAVDDGVAFYVDGVGVRYIIPQGNGGIVIEDKGSDTGQAVVIAEDNTSSNPAGSVALPNKFIEPTAFFHGSSHASGTGRVYPGSSKGSYMVSGLNGFGPADKSFSKNAVLTSVNGLDFEFFLDTDNAGRIHDMRISVGCTCSSNAVVTPTPTLDTDCGGTLALQDEYFGDVTLSGQLDPAGSLFKSKRDMCWWHWQTELEKGPFGERIFLVKSLFAAKVHYYYEIWTLEPFRRDDFDPGQIVPGQPSLASIFTFTTKQLKRYKKSDANPLIAAGTYAIETDYQHLPGDPESNRLTCTLTNVTVAATSCDDNQGLP